MPNLIVNIAGENRASRVEFGTMQIVQILTSQVDTLSFSMRLPETALAERPIIGQAIEVLEGTEVLFGGVIVQTPRNFDRSTGETIVSVSAQDYQVQMTRKRVAQSFVNQSAGAIATALLNVLPVSFGFSVGLIETGQILQRWDINYETVADAFERLAKTIGFEWYVAYDKKLYFFAAGSSNTNAPWNLTETATAPYTSSAAYNELMPSEDFTQLRNIVTVRGAKTNSVLVPQNEFGNGASRNFILNLGVVTAGSLTMTIGGVGQSIGEEGKIDPTLVSWLVNYQNRSVQATAGTPTPAANVAIVFQYRYETQIIVTARNASSIAAYGEIEHVIVNPEIKERVIATQVAKADLEYYGNPAETLRYKTTRKGLRAGMTQTVTIPRAGVNGDYLIKAVSISFFAWLTQTTAHQPIGEYYKNYSIDMERIR